MILLQCISLTHKVLNSQHQKQARPQLYHQKLFLDPCIELVDFDFADIVELVVVELYLLIEFDINLVVALVQAQNRYNL